MNTKVSTPLLLRNCLLIGLLWSCTICHSQLERVEDGSLPVNKKRMTTVVGLGAAFSAGSLIALNEAWYAQYERQSFHWFNDNKEWFGHDKVGHGVSAYYGARVAGASLRWAGLERNKAAALGSLATFAYLGAIEYMDGRSAAWGASPGDLFANAGGVGLYWLQDFVWQEQKVFPQFSFQQTPIALERPSLLGSQWYDRWLKDYNGQTYWLTADVKALFASKSNWPAWIGFSAGVGLDEMRYANPSFNAEQGFNGHREWFLAPAILLHKIPFKRKGLRSAAQMLVLFKVPTPTLEWSSVNGLQFRPFFF